MGEDRVSTLIVARPGPLRDGMEALLASVHQVQVIGKAGRAAKALCIASGCPLDLLLIEAGLPCDGVSRVLAFCRGQRPGLRCIVLADNAQEAREARALEVDAVFLQGFPPDRFVRTVERLLSNRMTGRR
jgi:DNA-binding NarL/FixJ family response regulator